MKIWPIKYIYPHPLVALVSVHCNDSAVVDELLVVASIMLWVCFGFVS